LWFLLFRLSGLLRLSAFCSYPPARCRSALASARPTKAVTDARRGSRSAPERMTERSRSLTYYGESDCAPQAPKLASTQLSDEDPAGS
jgi:hypothetical protein